MVGARCCTYGVHGSAPAQIRRDSIVHAGPLTARRFHICDRIIRPVMVFIGNLSGPNSLRMHTGDRVGHEDSLSCMLR